MKDAYCLPGQQDRQMFLIQGTVVEEGTVERERGPYWGENRYKVSVEKVYRYCDIINFRWGLFFGSQ